MTSCEGHAALPAEFRALLNGALDRIEPVVERIRVQQRSAPGDRAGEAGGVGSAGGSNGAGGPNGAVPMGSAAACGVCPICALVAVLRGERSELAAKAADHMAGLMAVLRMALDEGVGVTPSAGTGAPGAAADPPGGAQADGGSSRGSGSSGGVGETARRHPPHRPPGRPVQRITVRR
ncbi:MAG: hypothetical protein AB7J32_18040 [Pseudonocardia sp.]